MKWNLDILGNWKTVWTDANGDGTFADTNAEREDRTHNRANEITVQERPFGMGSQIVTQPSYDDAGNYRRNQPSGANRLTYTHDAWNRLVRVVRGTSTVVLENEFNGLNQRVKRRMDLAQGAYDGIDEERVYYYSASWQVLEEHTDNDLDDDVDRIGQQFWGARYIDDAVARRVDRTGAGTFSDDPADNFYYLTDVMFSVRAVTDSTGLLHTRLDYTPYGVAMHGFAADANGDGALTFDDLSIALANHNSGSDLEPGDTGYDPDAFLDGGDAVDMTAFSGRYNDYAPGGSNPTFNAGWIDNPEDPNGPDNSVGYDGYWFDLAGATEATSTGLYMVRHRVYDPKLGRWLQRDPVGFIGGANLYGYGHDRPTTYADPLGLTPAGVQTYHWANHGASHRRETVTMYDGQCGDWSVSGTSRVSEEVLVNSSVTLRRQINIHGKRPVRSPSQSDHMLTDDSGGIGLTFNYDNMWVPIGRVGSQAYERQPCKIVAEVQFSCSRECNACVITVDTQIDSTGSVISTSMSGRTEKRTQSCTVTRSITAHGHLIPSRGGGYWVSPTVIVPYTCTANLSRAIKGLGTSPCNSCPSSASETSEKVYSFRPGGGWTTIR